MSITWSLLFLAVIAGMASCAQNSTIRVKPKTTRTSLHVARSLDPSTSEFLQVRAKNGEMATLIVKKRAGKNSHPAWDRAHEMPSPSVETREPKSNFVPVPVEIRSDVVYVKDESQQKKKGRQLPVQKIENGVPVIEGVRVPDSPEDKFHTWRNAKVINGVLVPHKQSLNSEIPLKSTDGGKGEPEKQELVLSSHFDTKEIPSMFGEDDAVKTQWKGMAETVPVYKRRPEEPVPIAFAQQDKSHDKIIEFINKINRKEVQNRRKSGRSVGFDEKSKSNRRMDENVDENEEPIWTNDQPQEMWTENGKIDVADRRMDTVPESGYDKEDKFIPITTVHPRSVTGYPAYSDRPSRVSFEGGVRTPVLQYAHPELGAQPVKVDREDVELTRSKDTSLPSLKYFSDDPHADRSPYADEPGLSSLSEDSKKDESNSLGGSHERRQSVRNIEFTTSVADGPSSINPDEIDITESPDGVKAADYFQESYGQKMDESLQSHQHYGHPGKYSMSKEDYYKWKMSGMSYGNGLGPGEYYVRIADDRSFWEKLTDSIKESVQTGVENVKEMTRPVMEPIVEATQRISENLGISDATAKIGHTLGLGHGTGMRNVLQEKIGSAASGSPALLPALGLVGAGAALGLGAMAVGRLLDVDVGLLKRSNQMAASGLNAEQARVLEGAESLPEVQRGERTGKSVLERNGGGETGKEFKRLNGDESGMEELEKFHFDPKSENSDESKSRKRYLAGKKDEQDANEEYLMEIQARGIGDWNEFSARLAALERPNSWRNLPCAQKVFCESLRKRSNETVLETLKDKLVPEKENVDSNFVQQVLTQAKSQDCSSFACQTEANLR